MGTGAPTPSPSWPRLNQRQFPEPHSNRTKRARRQGVAGENAVTRGRPAEAVPGVRSRRPAGGSGFAVARARAAGALDSGSGLRGGRASRADGSLPALRVHGVHGGDAGGAASDLAAPAVLGLGDRAGTGAIRDRARATRASPTTGEPVRSDRVPSCQRLGDAGPVGQSRAGPGSVCRGPGVSGALHASASGRARGDDARQSGPAADGRPADRACVSWRRARLVRVVGASRRWRRSRRRRRRAHHL